MDLRILRGPSPVVVFDLAVWRLIKWRALQRLLLRLEALMRWLLVLTIISCGSLAAADAPRPNILYFYVDDMGWGSIGPNGQATRRAKGLPTVRTPNLDRLAAEGVNFTRGYGCHVCSPARSSQQTGFHQGHTFADRNDPDNAKKAIRADDICMGEALLAAGYATGYWGKWGYGGSKDMQNPSIENVQTLPTSHGYQHVLAELHHVRAHTFFQPTLWSAPAAKDSVGGMRLIPNSLSRYQNSDRSPGPPRSRLRPRPDPYPNTPALQNHADYPKRAYCDDSYAFAALEFVRQQGQQYQRTGKPFFGLLAVQIPHAPFKEITSLPRWDSAYRDDPHFKSLSPQAQQWAAMVTRTDAHFGNILAALEDPNNDGDTSDSIAANTLVIFQSDNGGPRGANNVELDANGGLRGNKGMIQEGGIRVPLVMRWPKRISKESKLKAGSNCEKVVDVTDLLPTFCELAGVSPPLGVDGVSIAPTLSGEGVQRPRHYIIHEAGNGQSIIADQYKLVRAKNGKLSLFDLKADRSESKDISAALPKQLRNLESQLLAERVTEPKGFANTYHRWQGDSGDVTSAADHWSDYRYSNAGVTYLTDDGPPSLSWVARIENQRKATQTAEVDRDLKVLALEIGGRDAIQKVHVSPGVHLVGRNEIRLSAHGVLILDGGKVSSARWIQIQTGAELQGGGEIHANIYNHGVLAANTKRPFSIEGAYYQSSAGRCSVGDSKQASLNVTGDAHLAGELAMDPSVKHIDGNQRTVIRANSIHGKFANQFVDLPDGSRWQLVYSSKSLVNDTVVLTRVKQ